MRITTNPQELDGAFVSPECMEVAVSYKEPVSYWEDQIRKDKDGTLTVKKFLLDSTRGPIFLSASDGDHLELWMRVKKGHINRR